MFRLRKNADCKYLCTFAFVSESQNRTTVFADGLVPLMLRKIEHGTECLKLFKK